jgi:hypothetical protein
MLRRFVDSQLRTVRRLSQKSQQSRRAEKLDGRRDTKPIARPLHESLTTGDGYGAITIH